MKISLIDQPVIANYLHSSGAYDCNFSIWKMQQHVLYKRLATLSVMKEVE